MPLCSYFGESNGTPLQYSCLENPRDGGAWWAAVYGVAQSRTEKGRLLHCWWECKLIQPLWKTVWRFPKKLGIKPPYDPAIPLLGIHTKETRIERDTCTPMFIAALFTIARAFPSLYIFHFLFLFYLMI